jgi:hypothetical protein
MPRAYRVPNTALDKIPRPPATINAHSGTVAQAASSNTFLAYRRGVQGSRQNFRRRAPRRQPKNALHYADLGIMPICGDKSLLTVMSTAMRSA